MRHFFVSLLVMEGVNIMTVKELMGHKTLETILRYSHLVPSYKTKAVNILDWGYDINFTTRGKATS